MKPLKHASDKDICALCDKPATHKIHEEFADELCIQRSSYVCNEHHAKLFDLELSNDV